MKHDQTQTYNNHIIKLRQLRNETSSKVQIPQKVDKKNDITHRVFGDNLSFNK